MQEFGLSYVATKHDRYIEETFLSAESVKRHAGPLAITVFTDRPQHPLCKLGCFDEVIPIETCTGFGSDWSEGQLDRISCLPRTRYKRTLNLDTDTRVFSGEVSSVAEILGDNDIGMVEDRQDFSFSAKLSGRRMFNAGFILYEANDAVLGLFREWDARVRRNFAFSRQTPLPEVPELAQVEDEDIRRRLLGIDQIALMEILSPEVNRLNLRLKILEKFWNYRGSVSKEDRRRIKILHADDLKATTRQDLLLVAHRWTQDRTAEAQAIYDYVGGFEPPAVRARSWFHRRAEERSEWDNPLFKRADLHLAYGQTSEAAAALDAVSDAPALLLAARARIALMQGQVIQTVELAESASRLAPDSEYVAQVHGQALMAAGRPVDALPVLERAAGRDRPPACFLLGQAHFALRNYSAAARAYKRALKGDPDHSGAENNLLPALLGHRKYRAALERADDLIAKRSWHVPAFAFKSVALAELGRLDEFRALHDFDRFIRSEDLPPPEGFRDIATFNRALAKAILNEPSLAFEPEGHATVYGRHTGDLSQSTAPAIRALNAAVLAAVARTIESTPRVSDHPFERALPRVYQLYSWAVVMDQGGHQRPHIHGRAWLSGVYYVDIPEGIRTDDPDRNGWLSFGRSEERWHRPGTKVPTREVFPRPGTLITFPSYFWHGTRALAGPAARISFAFDIVPL